MEEEHPSKTEKRTRPGARAFWASPAGQARKQKQHEQYAGRPNPRNLGWTGQSAVPTWKIARALTAGQSSHDAAKALGMKRRAIEERAKAVNLAYGTVFRCDAGEPFRDRHLSVIREGCGFHTGKDFEASAGLTARSCEPRGNPEMIRVPETAEAVCAWRDKAIRTLALDRVDKGRTYRGHDVLKTLLPQFAALRACLVETFTAIQSQLRKPEHKSWQIGDVWNFVCDRVQAGAPDSWHRTLCYLYEIEGVLSGKLAELREADWTKGQSKGVAGVVDGILAARYVAGKSFTVRAALREGGGAARVVPPAEMLGILLSRVQPAQRAALALPRTKGRGGRKPGQVTDESLDRILLAAALECLGQQKTYAMAPRLYPFSDRRLRKAAESATRLFRKRNRERIRDARAKLDVVKATEILATIHPR
jgi:hypothetical protein